MYAHYHETLHGNLTRARDVLQKNGKALDNSNGQAREEKAKNVTLMFPQALALEGINEKKPHACICVVLYILLPTCIINKSSG